MNEISRFIIIDDDPLNNALCTMTIKSNLKNSEVRAFTSPEKGLSYLSDSANSNTLMNTIILLDINMPTMSAWQFLEKFDLIQDEIKEKLKVYILSSSINSKDRKLAERNSNILNYLVKPLTREMIENILTHKE